MKSDPWRREKGRLEGVGTSPKSVFTPKNIRNISVTTPGPQTTPAPSDNPHSDEIGTVCANDPSNLWLDIIVAIDNTSSMAFGVNNVANHRFKITVVVVFRLQ